MRKPNRRPTPSPSPAPETSPGALVRADFLRDRIPSLSLLLFAALTAEIFLLPYPLPLSIRLYLPASLLISCALGLEIEFRIRRSFYAGIARKLEDLDTKYLLAELLPEPSFAEGRLLLEALRTAGKSMAEQVGRYRRIQEEYKEYIELWIHEVKTPISGARLLAENAGLPRLEDELCRIEGYTEQALYYARSDAAEQDYHIRECSVRQIVRKAAEKNRNALIGGGFRMETDGMELLVFTDPKWSVFLLGQILENCVKYAGLSPDRETPSRRMTPAQDRLIEIRAEESDERVTLSVTDHGIGIPAEDLPRIFEKGFTGRNGRLGGGKSTGIGLYLCRKLCTRLGMGIFAKSKEGGGTTVTLVFPKGSFLRAK